MRVYLAGPIAGRGVDEVLNRYREKVAVLSDFGYQTLNPMTGKGFIAGNNGTHGSQGYEYHPVATNHAIFERDKWMVTQADVVLADLSNSDDRVSIGTMMELAWASYLGKHVVVVLPASNIHNHLFVYEAADIVVISLEEAYDYLKALIRGDE